MGEANFYYFTCLKFPHSEMTFFFPIDAGEASLWEGFTFVIPAVSVGNVGQLAVDLLISTLKMKKVGYIYDESITPVIGNDPYTGCFSSRVGTMQLGMEKNLSTSTSSLMTSCEVYESAAERIVVMQLRSPLIRGRKSIFLNHLVDFIVEKKFSQTLILSSSHAHERIDAQLRGDQFRYVASSAFVSNAPLQKTLSILPWTRLETRENRDERGKDVNPYVPGGGVTKQLLVRCERDNIPVAALLVFCSEGDNVPEAFLLANRCNDLMQILPSEKVQTNWRVPSSWSALFGNPAAENELVYG